MFIMQLIIKNTKYLNVQVVYYQLIDFLPKNKPYCQKRIFYMYK
jgi:hypothetical protein